MAVKIYKTELRVIVFSEEPLDFNFVGLNDLAESIHTGDNIGDVSIVSRSEITDPGIVLDELLAIGNDGEFFQHDEYCTCATNADGSAELPYDADCPVHGEKSPTGWEEN